MICSRDVFSFIVGAERRERPSASELPTDGFARVRSSDLVRYHPADDFENVNPNAHPIATPTPTQIPMFAGATPVTAPITAPTHAPIADPTTTALLVFFLLLFIYLSICSVESQAQVNKKSDSYRTLATYFLTETWRQVAEKVQRLRKTSTK